MNKEELLKNFKSALDKKLKSEVAYYNFELTSACQTWIDSIVDYFYDCIEELIDNLEDYYDELDYYMDDFDEYNEECEFAWPNDAEAGAIVGKALRNDSSHFEYITNELNYSMAPADCIKAEWFWKGSIRPTIMEFIQDWIDINID